MRRESEEKERKNGESADRECVYFIVFSRVGYRITPTVLTYLSSLAKAAAPERALTERGAEFCRLQKPSRHHIELINIAEAP